MITLTASAVLVIMSVNGVTAAQFSNLADCERARAALEHAANPSGSLICSLNGQPCRPSSGISFYGTCFEAKLTASPKTEKK
jgi:hypothetical protein